MYKRVRRRVRVHPRRQWVREKKVNTRCPEASATVDDCPPGVAAGVGRSGTNIAHHPTIDLATGGRAGEAEARRHRTAKLLA